MPVDAQAPAQLADLIAVARTASPELRGAREAVLAAAGLERQAVAFANPVLNYGREQTSRGGQTNSQDILQLEQPLEPFGLRAARREAARSRREAAEAQLVQMRTRVDADVARAYAFAVAADQRAHLATQFATVVTEAQRVSDQRLAAGDVSGYAARRLRLEAARFAAVRAAAMLEQRHARVVLASMLGRPPAAADSLVLPDDLSDATTLLTNLIPREDVTLDSLIRLAGARRADVRAVQLEAAGRRADARVVARSRFPVPVLSAGYKGERVAGGPVSTGGFSGFVAGVSVPLPLFDRRAGAVGAADATARVSDATVDALMRRVAEDVANAVDAMRGAEAQRRTLAPHMGDDARIALVAVQASYTEGEISLVEWLDAVRAYQDAQSSYATLLAEVTVRRATLAQALGLPLLPDTRAPGTDAAAAPIRKN